MLSGVLEAECQAQVESRPCPVGRRAVDELQFERDSNSRFSPTAPGSFPVFGRGFAGSLIRHACAMLGWYVVEQIAPPQPT